MKKLTSTILNIIIVSLLTSCLSKSSDSENNYFVSKTGSDANDGSSKKPFLTIQKAADVAQPGDVITVREGIYREAISIKRGGSSENLRIIYQAAEGENVQILGSEKANNWTELGDGKWKTEIDTSFFKGFNPFNTLTRHPQHVAVDESGDGWGWLKYGRWTHLGDVIIDGEGLTEQQQEKDISDNQLAWYTETAGGITTIWANFGNRNPNSSDVEINARPFAFQPDSAGLGYITIRGFKIQNIANHWAPPTVYQPGAIWANGGHHWIIEDNLILYSKGAAISLGIPNDEADQSASGHHIIRNNVIMRCGQGATTGQSWNSNSLIHDNHIEEINYRKEFGGWETAGIKHHGCNKLVIKDNFIRGVYTLDPDTGAAHGIWNDFQNTNWKVSENVIMNTDGHAILTEANWEGPNIYMNNLISNGSIGSFSSRGDTWVHNLLIESKQIWENQPWGERPQLGKLRWINNIFVAKGLDSTIVADNDRYENNVYLDGASANPKDSSAVKSDLSTDYRLLDTKEGIVLVMNLDEKILQNEYPEITHELIDLNFSIDVTNPTDFFGNDRNQNFAGPFANLQAGKNEWTIYTYPELYKEALKMINKNESFGKK